MSDARHDLPDEAGATPPGGSGEQSTSELVPAPAPTGAQPPVPPTGEAPAWHGFDGSPPATGPTFGAGQSARDPFGRSWPGGGAPASVDPFGRPLRDAMAPPVPGAYADRGPPAFPEVPLPATGVGPPPGLVAPVEGQVPGAASPLAQPYVLASWWRRVGATVVDAVAVLLAMLAGVLPFGIGAYLAGAASGDDVGLIALAILLGIAAFVALVAIGLCLLPIWMARTGGQTPGKQLLDLRVVRSNGEPVTFRWALLRELLVKGVCFGSACLLGFVVPFLPWLTWGIDTLWPLWDDEHRALHDMIVSSRVVEA